ncbi:hypothetical protein GCM10011575_35450 [Microlunatus endophyticus]|uniref:Lipoprotein n=1 Tax=Microlunatus endophyticus TaxID=1716077 RepID=A0A917W7F9_9ACTN|nr:hypothetical protein GCM10011575_35450 [Microlunatus endophyticus]
MRIQRVIDPLAVGLGWGFSGCCEVDDPGVQAISADEVAAKPPSPAAALSSERRSSIRSRN